MVDQKQLRLARELLKNIRHAAMATVNEDGTPHNTPYKFMRSPGLSKLYWGSHARSLHTKNIERTGRLFVVLFDSLNKGKGGIYITAKNAHRLTGKEFDEGLAVHSSIRTLEGSEPLDPKYYGTTEQNMYGADIEKIEILSVVRREDGRISQETRQEVDRKLLLGR
jgi:hypothetical protein